MENKTSTYLKYAIGEIALVVIGVLIALQISNWNEASKRNNSKHVYTHNLKSDLTKDTIQLNIQKGSKAALKTADSILAFINNSNTTLDDSKHFIKRTDLSGLRTLNSDNTNSFKLLVSTGNIDFFDNQLMQELMELNRLQNYEIFVSNGNSAIYCDLSRAYFENYVSNSTLKANQSLNDQLWKDDDAVKLSTLYVNRMEIYT